MPPWSRDYSAADPAGKAACRDDLCARLGIDPGGPVMGVVGRLDPQKGFDLVTWAGAGLIDAGRAARRPGHRRPHASSEGLRSLAAAHPDRVVILERFDRDEARRIYAGSDVFLMPSRFEPSGQGQLIAMRYGTVPLVRSTGGLTDTVIDADEDPAAGTGFGFGPADPVALLDAATAPSPRTATDPDGPPSCAAACTRTTPGTAPAARYEAAYVTLLDRDRRSLAAGRAAT